MIPNQTIQECENTGKKDSIIFTNIRMNSRYAMVFMGLLFLLALGFASSGQAGEGVKADPKAFSDDLRIIEADVIFNQALDVFVFEQRLEGNAGSSTPQARGQLDGAPVLAYVFVTDLNPQAVGFGAVDNGILALAVTSHPDFDDTPLWDENGDRVYDNDGVIYHTHWVVLVKDTCVDGGLSVFQFQEGQAGVILPPTNPGMLIYLDSPGFQVNLKEKSFKLLCRHTGSRTARILILMPSLPTCKLIRAIKEGPCSASIRFTMSSPKI